MGVFLGLDSFFLEALPVDVTAINESINSVNDNDTFNSSIHSCIQEFTLSFNKSFVIGHINPGSLYPHIEDVKYYINKCKFSALGVSET